MRYNDSLMFFDADLSVNTLQCEQYKNSLSGFPEVSQKSLRNVSLLVVIPRHLSGGGAVM